MNANAFIDTNILIYAHTDLDLRKQARSQELILSNETWISTQVLQEISNVLSKKFGKNWNEVRAITKNIAESNAVYTNTVSTIDIACGIASRYKYSFYDSLILSASLECACATLFTEDLATGQVIEGKLGIVNPFL